MSEVWPEGRDGLEEVPGGVVFHAAGKSYRVNKSTTSELAQDYAAVEEHLLRDRKGPIEAILPEMEALAMFPKLQKEFLDRAYDDLKRGKTQKQLSVQEVKDWMDTLPGILFMFGKLLRRLNPDVTDGDVLEVLTRVGQANIEKARDDLSRDAALKVAPGFADDATAHD